MAQTSDEREKIRLLAEMVSARLGGAVAVSAVRTQSWPMATSDLKQALNTNVLPLNQVGSSSAYRGSAVTSDTRLLFAQICCGTYFHRALLFKVLADQCGIPSALIRGQYQRAYNVAYLPSPHVVDIMHVPGAVYEIGSPDGLAHATDNFFALLTPS